MPLAINHLKFKAMNKTNPFPILSGLLFCILLFMASCKPDTGAEFLYSDQFPELSPDGSMLVYFHWDYQVPESSDYPTGLYILNLEKNERSLVVEGIYSWTSWAPDNRRFVYVSAEGLSIFDLLENSVLNYSNTDIIGILAPDWSMDGQEILFTAHTTSGGGVFSISSDFETFRRIFDWQDNNGMFARWSPCRNKLVYSKGSQQWEGTDIFSIDTALINEVRLTNDTRVNSYPKWSPDGTMIAFESYSTSSVPAIFVMDTNGTNERRLDYGKNPTWSPDSEYIIYSRFNDDMTKELLWKISISDTEKLRLTF